MSDDLDLAHRCLAIDSVHDLQLEAEWLTRIVVDDLHGLGQVRGASCEASATGRLHIELHVLLSGDLQLDVAHAGARLVLEVSGDCLVTGRLLVEGEADRQGRVLERDEGWECGPAEQVSASKRTGWLAAAAA